MPRASATHCSPNAIIGNAVLSSTISFATLSTHSFVSLLLHRSVSALFLVSKAVRTGSRPNDLERVRGMEGRAPSDIHASLWGDRTVAGWSWFVPSGWWEAAVLCASSSAICPPHQGQKTTIPPTISLLILERRTRRFHILLLKITTCAMQRAVMY
ncbi:hypothetical protein PENSPDRAFT_436466 [Peniophora sp. CONT]|nr:hypothetical protein PENSPDRAFT_436466 [Peniophora sp. CONT]